VTNLDNIKLMVSGFFSGERYCYCWRRFEAPGQPHLLVDGMENLDEHSMHIENQSKDWAESCIPSALHGSRWKPKITFNLDGVVKLVVGYLQLDKYWASLEKQIITRSLRVCCPQLNCLANQTDAATSLFTRKNCMKSCRTNIAWIARLQQCVFLKFPSFLNTEQK
jgi:hypothetical protein